MRGGLPERFGDALHFRQGFASRFPAAGSAGADDRVLKMVSAMDAEGFGNCTNTYECEAVCPAKISASLIAKLNREYAIASLRKNAGE